MREDNRGRNDPYKASLTCNVEEDFAERHALGLAEPGGVKEDHRGRNDPY